MPRTKNESPRREPPIQLRAGPELGRLVGEFAAQHALPTNEACKCLIALAVTALDCRFYGLLRQMAAAMGGTNAFVRACTHVHAALAGAGRVRGEPIQSDPERARFVFQTVHDFLTGRNLRVEEAGLWFAPEEQGQQMGAPEATRIDPSRRRRRKVRHLDIEEPPSGQGPEEGQTDDKERARVSTSQG